VKVDKERFDAALGHLLKADPLPLAKIGTPRPPPAPLKPRKGR